jgi:hypothetical protein
VSIWGELHARVVLLWARGSDGRRGEGGARVDTNVRRELATCGRCVTRALTEVRQRAAEAPASDAQRSGQERKSERHRPASETLEAR